MIRRHAAKLVALTDAVLCADVWQRPELPPRDRSLITVAALVALGRDTRLNDQRHRAPRQRPQTRRTHRDDHPSRVPRGLTRRHERGRRPGPAHRAPHWTPDHQPLSESPCSTSP
ncbi:carboxymuconolactone decarboxylase family protein [Streptomyces sp. NPDC057616]|uniref:carboxymuconolactone decarboxylase family protein n=1 Tax=Streptomyces sp. NPDC057616 TaxID=3346183 RepID=UPI00367F81FC